MDNLHKYELIFMNTFNVKKEDLNDSFTFKDVAVWDSVSHLSLISALEDEFDIFFEAEDILHYGSFLNGIEILKKYGVVFEK